MDVTRSPFVVAACDDLNEHRTCWMSVTDLLTHPAADSNNPHPDPDVAPRTDLNPHETHEVTRTFLSLWRNLSLTGSTTRELILSVMHGITIEPRHPAYRVAATTLPHTYESQVGDNATLVFRVRTDTTPVWLAVLHAPTTHP